MDLIEGYEINIKMKGFNENPIAIVTLTIEERIEIRYAPIYWKEKRTGIFFSMPALGRLGFCHCVVFLDIDEYHKLSIDVLTKFKKIASEKYTKEQSEIIDKLVDEQIKLINEIPSDIHARQ